MTFPESPTIEGLPRPRILAVGGRTEVLETITDELAAAGLVARGETIERALAGIDGAFDLISFGAGVSTEIAETLERRLRRNSPGARFIRTYAPYAAHQIATAARGIAPPTVDLPAYCDRIGYKGPLEPTIETLRALQQHHLASISFEAIDVLLDRGIDLAPQAVDAKLIGGRRGGYCYEQNGLFKRVLAAIGFAVDGLVAGVRWMKAPGAPPPPRTHMALRVTIDGTPWLADVGFGSSVPPAPLRLDIGDEQPTGHESFRFVGVGSGLYLQARIQDGWQTLYDLSPEPMLDGHYALFNWYTSTSPASIFRQKLIVARITADARHTLLDNRLTIRSADGAIERRHLDASGIGQALGDIFLLDVEAAWRPLIERAAAQLT
ncbi:arylamine N-acetyltransferase family protein [Sphingomonas colocasiae]|uniref:Arylamine N-acetyltransferase n=1 Tax=Sphingomonas colocasiae TaxID=1848973 RepID=A0ABS7PKL0_9SPHN|nr:arylamine N-acetyltransferase [Sphingomonas colocasiae]MBY8821773.1 arylamine N-acetyltransferase [Sphingomonas colocasiae]